MSNPTRAGLELLYALAVQHDFEPASTHGFVNSLIQHAREVLGDLRDWDGKVQACRAAGCEEHCLPGCVGIYLDCGICGHGSTAQAAADVVFIKLGIQTVYSPEDAEQTLLEAVERAVPQR